jgi:replicative DNA helicase
VRALKLLARTLRVPIPAISQLNRGLETRTIRDKRPILADLRETGALEEEADLVLLLYRDEVYNRESMDLGIAEVNVAKQRWGPTGRVRLRFFAQYTRFDNIGYDEMYAAEVRHFVALLMHEWVRWPLEELDTALRA